MYNYFHVIGLQRSGTTWLRLLILNNFQVQENDSFWKHQTPLGVKSKYKHEKFQSKNFILDPNTFYISTQKDFTQWIESIKRKKVDTYKRHNAQSLEDIYEAWTHWNYSNLHLTNYYYKRYNDWYNHWKLYFSEIESLTGWKRKFPELKNVDLVPRSQDSNLEIYKTNA